MLLDRTGARRGSLGDAALDGAVRDRALALFAEGTSEVLEAGPSRVFIEVRLPPPRLVIVGAVHIAVTLGRLAREMGFRVVVCDARDRFATPERFPDVDELVLGWPNEVLPRLGLDEFSYVVVITHDAKLDNPALAAALRSPAPYVGALGSKRTHARRVKALREAGIGDEDIARIHAPIGLEIGARTPEEIALATMAEIVAVRRGAAPAP
jgi:xanthine dehydrogenase accessory factor